MTSSHWKLGARPDTASPLEPPEGTSPADTLILDTSLQNYKKTIHLCSLSHAICGTLLQQPN